MLDNNIQLDGALLAARYAFMPNKLRYCGGDKNRELFEYVVNNQNDAGLEMMLKEFETMYPYLKLIAEANQILDPFNYRVVEAYWLGNELLENISLKNFYRYLIDEQKLKKRFKPKILEKVFGKIPLGAKPHHSWHVFNIPKRTGHYPVEHSLETMDECRIGWGQITKTQKHPSSTAKLATGRGKNTKSPIINTIFIDSKPLILDNNRLKLGEAVEREVWYESNEKAFIKQPKMGDWVSIHWGWVCDFLTENQVKNLEKWTKYNLALASL
ncbi:MAG: DUF6390 family protein [Patescibacteria group bacterium]